MRRQRINMSRKILTVRQNKSTEYNIKNNSTPVGLGSYWGEVLDVLQEIIPVYDKVNSYISLGKDSEHPSQIGRAHV